MVTTIIRILTYTIFLLNDWVSLIVLKFYYEIYLLLPDSLSSLDNGLFHLSTKRQNSS